MGEPYVIAEPCVGVKDKACVAACPVDCIYIYDTTQKKFVAGNSLREANPAYTEEQLTKQLFIHPEECISCGACVEPCPVAAIFVLDDLPEKWKDFVQLNKDVFAPQ